MPQGRIFKMHWFAVMSSVVLWTLVRSFQVRLVGSGGRLRGGCSGQVEVSHGGAWRSLCAYHQDQSVAQLVCQELACGDRHSLYYNRSGAVPGVLLSCEDQETALLRCTRKFLLKLCHVSVGVVCTGSFPVDFPTEPENSIQLPVTMVTPRQQARMASPTSSSLPCSCAVAPTQDRLFPAVYTSLLLCGLAVMVAAVLVVEVVAKRRRD